MSRLFVIVRPMLAPGFHLAGVEAFPAEDIEAAEEFTERLLREGEPGLLAIDDGLLERMSPALVRRLEASEQLFHMEIPGGRPLEVELSREQRLAAMIRRAIGVHVRFGGEDGHQGEPEG